VFGFLLARKRVVSRRKTPTARLRFFERVKESLIKSRLSLKTSDVRPLA